MIWVRGAIVADDDLKVSVLDRTFEHGLGLFETFRTWNGHATLLGRHLERIIGSARTLGLPLGPPQLPDKSAVEALRLAEGVNGDTMLRVTMSAGRTELGESLLWMRCAPPPKRPETGGAVIHGIVAIQTGNVLDQHKTLNYWRRRLAYQEAQATGADEVLFATEDGSIWEGSRTNLFLFEANRLVTPCLDGPVLPGIMRGVVIEQASSLGMSVCEERLTLDRVEAADEVFLTNSGRGMIPVARLFGRRLTAPGLSTRSLWDRVRAWLESGGESIWSNPDAKHLKPGS